MLRNLVGENSLLALQGKELTLRDFAAQQGVDEQAALSEGMEQKVVEFVRRLARAGYRQQGEPLCQPPGGGKCNSVQHVCKFKFETSVCIDKGIFKNYPFMLRQAQCSGYHSHMTKPTEKRVFANQQQHFRATEFLADFLLMRSECRRFAFDLPRSDAA